MPQNPKEHPGRPRRNETDNFPLGLALVLGFPPIAGLKYQLRPAFWVAWVALALWAGARLVHFIRVWRIARTGDTVQHLLESDEYAGEEVVRQVCNLERRRVVIPTLVYSLMARLPLKPSALP